MERIKETRAIPPNQLNLMGKAASKILDMLTTAPTYIKSYEDMELVLGMVKNMVNAGREKKDE